MIGDGVDQYVAGPPERVQVAGAERAGDRLAHTVSIFRGVCGAGAACEIPRLATGLLPLAPSEYLVIVAPKTPEAMVRSS
jgi:hypothetical protein